MIDHALLRPESTRDSFKRLCAEAKKYRFYSVCVNPAWVKFCAEELRGTDIKVVAVVSFPFGQMTSKMKALEASEAIENGAAEIDMVMNLGAFKSQDYEYVREDIKAVVEAVRGSVVKVIIEAGYLTDDEVIKACEIAKRSGASFVKTATGFGPSGATVYQVYLMRKAVGENFGVKASGGIRSLRDALLMIATGANRIGSSSSVRIVEECMSVQTNK
ncbi:MAG: deoxyribose-phosphate aldolase [Candidatus Hadarchaeum sp.]|uniref:deoxyribose-phosphate aldolase n=1 Tax=Candidatus Hadarchaeum sp. TaxID=2883567 RepID=UPI003D0BA103